MKSLRQASGITLIELLVTMMVLSIGILLASPNFSAIGGGARLETHSREIQSALLFARSEAIRLNRNVVFCHTQDGQVCSTPPSSGWQGWLVRAAGATIGTETGPVLRSHLFSDTVVIIRSNTALASAQNVLRFNSQGLIRMFDSNTPLSDSIRICIADTSLNPNLVEVHFNSGGRLRQTSTDTDGVCS